MIRKLLHTPEGVRDIYNEECEQKMMLEHSLREVVNSYGYRNIETPSIEFFDVFSSDVGTVSSRELYKFFDRENNTLVLRPDFTPSIARAVSKYFMDEDRPIRLCYQGNTFVNNSSYQGRMTESTQLGAELIGDAGVEADAEMIAMAVDTLQRSGLKEFQISIGHVQFFECLAAEAGFDETIREELKKLIKNRNTFGVEKLLSEQNISNELLQIFKVLPNLFGGEEIISRVRTLTSNPGACQALDRLAEVMELLKVYGVDRHISIDLGMLGSHMYYTGLIFRGYTYGTGDAVIKGGRYDNLLARFGKEAPSIGYVIVINQLMNALFRQKIAFLPEHERYLIVYCREHRKEAVLRAMEYRRQGKYVELRMFRSEEELQQADNCFGSYAGIIRVGG